jgi:hypothetical protein
MCGCGWFAAMALPRNNFKCLRASYDYSPRGRQHFWKARHLKWHSYTDCHFRRREVLPHEWRQELHLAALELLECALMLQVPTSSYMFGSWAARDSDPGISVGKPCIAQKKFSLQSHRNYCSDLYIYKVKIPLSLLQSTTPDFVRLISCLHEPPQVLSWKTACVCSHLLWIFVESNACLEQSIRMCTFHLRSFLM